MVSINDMKKNILKLKEKVKSLKINHILLYFFILSIKEKPVVVNKYNNCLIKSTEKVVIIFEDFFSGNNATVLSFSDNCQVNFNKRFF